MRVFQLSSQEVGISLVRVWGRKRTRSSLPLARTPAPRVRAEKLDEGLAILVGLWSGEVFSHHGRYYTVDETVFRPRPLQRPRIPIWVAGRWPARPPFRRAARWDGVF